MDEISEHVSEALFELRGVSQSYIKRVAAFLDCPHRQCHCPRHTGSRHATDRAFL